MKKCYCDLCGMEGATETYVEVKHDRVVHTHVYAITLDSCKKCHDELEALIKQLIEKKKALKA